MERVKSAGAEEAECEKFAVLSHGGPFVVEGDSPKNYCIYLY